MATDDEEGKLLNSLGSLTTSVKRGVATAFTRARQSTEEWLGQAERTSFDSEFERMAQQADNAKMWTERLIKQAEVVIRPSPNERLENFILTKLDRPLPSRPTPADVLGQHMIDASTDFGATPYGKALLKCGQAEQKVGSAQRDMIAGTVNEFIAPLKRFLNDEMRTINRERGVLNSKRLDRDAAASREKRARTPEQAVQLQKESRKLHSEFEQQYEITRRLLSGLKRSQVSHIQHLQVFMEAQELYHQRCSAILAEVKEELQSAFQIAASPSLLEFSGQADESEQVEETAEERRARVLYDYDAQADGELSLLADEVITVWSTPGLDTDYLMAERGGEKGLILAAYVEFM